MAWWSSGATNGALIDNLRAAGIIQSNAVECAMKAIDRRHFSPSSPYQDAPQVVLRVTWGVPVYLLTCMHVFLITMNRALVTGLLLARRTCMR